VVHRPAGKSPSAYRARILDPSPFPAPKPKPAKPLSALPRISHHDRQQRRSGFAPVMTAEMLWAAAGLASSVDQDDSLAPIFALDRTRQLYLIEHGQIETGAEAVLRLRSRSRRHRR
jgi:hypothetical protein